MARGNVGRRIDSILDESRPAGHALERGRRRWLMAAAFVAIYLSTTVYLAPAQSQTGTESDPYTKWLNEDVVYIIGDAERAAFLKLPTNEEREYFIEQFWLRRDPTPATAENEFKREHYRRISYANQRFAVPGQTGGWRTDRGRIYIQNGPPDEIEAHPAGGPRAILERTFGPLPSNAVDGDRSAFEVWFYRKSNWFIGFIDQNRTGEYKLLSTDSHWRILQSNEPRYTPGAMAAGVEGVVGLSLTIGVDGTAQNVRVTQSLEPGLDQKAVECVMTWRFQPAVRGGQAVPTEIEKLYIAFRRPR
jgi:TonB family protein